MKAEQLKIGDKVEFSFCGEMVAGTISEINGDIYVADFDEPVEFREYRTAALTYHLESAKFVKVSGTIEHFKKKQQ